MAEYYRREDIQGPRFQRGDGLDNFMKAGGVLQNALNSVREREIENQKLARLDAEYQRAQNERAAQDAYAESIAAGPQSISFEGTDVNKVLDSYKTKDGKYDDAKLEKFAQDHIAAVQSGKLSESRSDMLKRTADDIRQKGLPVPMQLVQAYDQSRLAEMEALKARDASLAERINALQKQELDMAKWMVQQQSRSDASGSADDSSGPSQKANDKAGTAVVDIVKKVMELPGNNRTGVLTGAIGLFNDVKTQYPNLTDKEIEAAISTTLGSYDGWFSSPEATFKPDTAIKALEEMNKRFPAGTRREDVLGTENTRGNMAISLGELQSRQNAAELNRLMAEREALLNGPMSDRDRVNEWLNRSTTTTGTGTPAIPKAEEKKIEKVIEETLPEGTVTKQDIKDKGPEVVSETTKKLVQKAREGKHLTEQEREFLMYNWSNPGGRRLLEAYGLDETDVPVETAIPLFRSSKGVVPPLADSMRLKSRFNP